jgi:hypothetical protein
MKKLGCANKELRLSETVPLSATTAQLRKNNSLL